MVVSGGSAGIRGICWGLHLEIAGSSTEDMVGVFAVAGGELCGAAGYTQDHRVASRQFVAGDEAGGLFFWDQFPADLFRGIISRDGASLAVPFNRTAPIWRIPGLLPAATGGVELLCDEPAIGSVSEA